MSVSVLTFATPQPRRAEYLRGLTVLLVIAVIGLFIVKWNPYYHRIQSVFFTHSMGRSIVFAKDLITPGPSVAAAVGYAVSYFKAIWQAWLLGFLLAATIETLLPRNWLATVLGKVSVRSALLGGAAALPGMM